MQTARARGEREEKKPTKPNGSGNCMQKSIRNGGVRPRDRKCNVDHLASSTKSHFVPLEEGQKKEDPDTGHLCLLF